MIKKSKRICVLVKKIHNIQGFLVKIIHQIDDIPAEVPFVRVKLPGFSADDSKMVNAIDCILFEFGTI